MPDPIQALSSNINLGLPAQVPENFTQPEVIAAVRLLITSINNLLRGVEQYTGITQKDSTLWSLLTPLDTILKYNLGRLYVLAGENLSQYHFINLYDDAGTLKARKATSYDGAAPRKAHGYCNQDGGALNGTFTEVIIGQGIVQINGVNPGQDIYLSTSAGLASVTPDTTAGHLEQHLGFGVGGTNIVVDIALGPYVKH
jgi:hypothetical protein